MKRSIIKTSLLFTIIALFLCYSSNVFADSFYLDPQGDRQSGSIQIVGNCLEVTGPNTCTFQYKIIDSNGRDVTSKLENYDARGISAMVFRNLYASDGGHWAKTEIDLKTGTCTITYDSMDSYKLARIDMVVADAVGHTVTCKYSGYLPIVNPNSKAIDKIWVLSDSLTDGGQNTASFNYGIFNEAGTNITKDIPASNIEAFAVVYSTTFSATTVDSTTTSATEIDSAASSSATLDSTTSSATTLDSNKSSATILDTTTSSATIITTSSSTVVYSPVNLDPSGGRGTIKFNTSYDDKITATTLIDTATGKNSTLNTIGLGKNESQDISPTEVHRIDFTSNNLIKTASDTAKFNYKVLNHYFSNITNGIPQSDIDAYAEIGTSKIKINLDPKNGEGTLKYNFSDADKEALITITYKTGVTICERMNIVSAESESTEDKSNKDLKIARIEFAPTGPSIYYRVFNKYGRDITKEIPISELSVCSSVNCIINLSDVLKIGTYNECIVNYNNYNNNRTIILTLMDRLSDVKASINIGNQPEESSEDKTTSNL